MKEWLMAKVDEIISDRLQRLAETELPDSSLAAPSAAWDAVRVRATAGGTTGGRRALAVVAAGVVVLAAAALASYGRNEIVQTPATQPAPTGVVSPSTSRPPPSGVTSPSTRPRSSSVSSHHRS
jgi:hypothetical protein